MTSDRGLMPKSHRWRPYLITLVLLLFVLFHPFVGFSVTETVSASSVWVQTDSADFSGGELGNVEVKEYDGEAFVRLARSGAWAKVAPDLPPSARKGHAMVFDESSGVSVLFGGRNETAYFDDTWLYNAGANMWAQTIPLPPISPSPREGHSMVYDSENELIILFGGHDGTDYLSDTWTYSTADGVWTSITPVLWRPVARAWSAMSYDRASGYALLYGGKTESGYLNDTWKFDLDESAWTPISPPDPPKERHSHSMVYDESLDLHILTAGFSKDTLQNDTWAFDPQTESWENLSATVSPMPMANHSLVYDSLNEDVYVFGGYRNKTIGGVDGFSSLPCDIPVGDLATTILEFEGHFYIGSSNASNHAHIYRYDPATGECEKWNDAGVYYVYSSGKYGGVAFWGNRGRRSTATGPLLYYDGMTFGTIPGEVWFTTSDLSGWIEDFEVFNDRLFASGTIMKATPENENNFFVKYCDNPPCRSSVDWHWTNTSPENIGYLDDGAELEEFNGDLYLATYDSATVLRYYPSNNTWWRTLSGPVDGDTEGMKGGYGIFALVNYSGYLHALTYHNGWHWKTPDGVSWTGVNLSYEILTRAFVYDNNLYTGASDSSGDYLLSYDGSSWLKAAFGSTHFRYFALCGTKLCVSSGNHVFEWEPLHNDFWKFLPSQNYWVEVADARSPTDRDGFGFSYDRQHNVMVLFGGADELQYFGETYIFDRTVGSGVFTSRTFDSGETSARTVWESISWSARSQPEGSSMRFQIATNNDESVWVFRGPDGTPMTYYTDPQSQGIWAGHEGDRYLRFRAYLSTTSALGPALDRVEIEYDRFSRQLTSTEIAMITAAAVVFTLIVLMLVVSYRRRKKEESPPTATTAGKATQCTICEEKIEEGSPFVKCSECGKTFHEKCATKTEKCPHCESKLDLSEIVEE
jgi:N-acetylneuraminic acid mutarotase